MKASTGPVARPDVVMLDLTADSREAALRAVHARLATVPGVIDPDRLLLDVLERAMVAGICIAPDVALPHARTGAVDRVVLAVARVAAPGVACDGEHPTVRLIFMIATPRHEVTEYLDAVATITRLLRSPGAHDALLAAHTESEFRALLAQHAAL